jgi:hypothetical protein
MRVSDSQSRLSATAWDPYATSKAWALSASEGTKTVYAEYRDAAGNTAVAQDTIGYRRQGDSLLTRERGPGSLEDTGPLCSYG